MERKIQRLTQLHNRFLKYLMNIVINSIKYFFPSLIPKNKEIMFEDVSQAAGIKTLNNDQLVTIIIAKNSNRYR